MRFVNHWPSHAVLIIHAVLVIAIGIGIGQAVALGGIHRRTEPDGAIPIGNIVAITVRIDGMPRAIAG